MRQNRRAPSPVRKHPETNSFESDAALKEFVRNFDALAAADGLIIDLRANDGGNSDYGDEILSHLTDKPFRTAR